MERVASDARLDAGPSSTIQRVGFRGEGEEGTILTEKAWLACWNQRLSSYYHLSTRSI